MMAKIKTGQKGSAQPNPKTPYTPTLPKHLVGIPQLQEALKPRELIPIVVEIFRFMDEKTRARAACVSKLWQVVSENIGEDDEEEDGEVQSGEDTPDEDQWQEYNLDSGQVVPKSSAGAGGGGRARGGGQPAPAQEADSDEDVPPPPPPPDGEDDDAAPPPPPPRGGGGGGGGSSPSVKSPLKGDRSSAKSPGGASRSLSPAPRKEAKEEKDGSFSGWMKKRSNANRHMWQKRYFMFKPPNPKAPRPIIRYYKTEKEQQQGKKEQGTIYLDLIKDLELATRGKGSETRCRFDIKLPTKEYHLISDTSQEAQKWIKIISSYQSYTVAGSTELMQGMLMMKSAKGWQKRFWVLDSKKPPHLAYYKNEKEKNSGRAAARLATIGIKHVKGVELALKGEGSDRGVRFDLQIDFAEDQRPGKGYAIVSLMAESYQDCRKWVEALQKQGVELK